MLKLMKSMNSLEKFNSIKVIRSQNEEVRLVEVISFISSAKMNVLVEGGLAVFHDYNVVIVVYTQNRGV